MSRPDPVTTATDAPASLAAVGERAVDRIRILLDAERDRWSLVDPSLAGALDALRVAGRRGRQAAPPRVLPLGVRRRRGRPGRPTIAIDAGRGARAAAQLRARARRHHGRVRPAARRAGGAPRVHRPARAVRLAGPGPPLRRGRGDPRRRLRVRLRRRADGAASPRTPAASSTSCASSCASASTSTSAPPRPAGATPTQARTIEWYKSGKYTVERPLHLGAALAGRLDELRAPLSAFGLPLGEAFQLRDDLLGVFGDRGRHRQAGRRRPARGQAHAAARRGRRRAPTARTSGCSNGSAAPISRADEIAALRDLLVARGAVDEIEADIERLVAESLAALETVPITDDAEGRAGRPRPVRRLARPLTPPSSAADAGRGGSAGRERSVRDRTAPADRLSRRWMAEPSGRSRSPGSRSATAIAAPSTASRFAIAARRGVRAARPERRGQDDDRRDPRGLPQPRRRRRCACSGSTPWRDGAGAAPAHRRDAPGGRALPGRPAARGAPAVRRRTTTTPTTPSGCSTSSGSARSRARSCAGSRAASASASRSRSRSSAGPRSLFLDEPTAGMDPRARATTWELVRELRDRGHHRRAHHPRTWTRPSSSATASRSSTTAGSSRGARPPSSRTVGGRRPAVLDRARARPSPRSPPRSASPADAVRRAPAGRVHRSRAAMTPALVADLAVWLRDKGYGLTELRTGGRPLEEVFLQLTAGGRGVNRPARRRADPHRAAADAPAGREPARHARDPARHPRVLLEGRRGQDSSCATRSTSSCPACSRSR